MESGDQGTNKRQRRHKWGTIIAMALVFGLIAGGVTYGVYRFANYLHPVVPKGEASVSGSGRSGAGEEAVRASSLPDAAASSSGGTPSAGQAVPSGDTAALSVEAVTANCMPSLVTISTMSVQEMQSFFGGTEEYQVQGAGTGVIIGANDTELLVATNNHVVEGAEQLSVGFVDESVVSGSIKGTDEADDLAVVAVKLSDISGQTMGEIRSAVIGDSDELVLGEQVVAIGNALGYGQSVTSGYVSGLNRSLTLQDGNRTIESDGLIQTDAAINSGNSGGALLNMKGELVGINEAKSSTTGSGTSVDNIGYAIPMAKAQPILERLMNEETREIVGEDERGYLGVSVADVTSEYSQVYHMPEGVCFTSVSKNGPAGEAGAKKGDVLTSFDGKSVSSYDSLERILQYYKAGEQVSLTVERNENGEYREVELTVTLGSKEVLNETGDTESSGNEQDSPFRNSLFNRIFGGN